jgi:hypothetical protein
MANNSLQQDIMDAIKTVAQSTVGTGSGASTDILNAQFYVRKVAVEEGLTFPAVVIIPLQEQYGTPFNNSDRIGYRARVVVAQEGNRDPTASQDLLQEWRQLLAAAFNQKRLSGVDAVHLCEVEPESIFPESDFYRNLDTSSFVVRAWCKIAR